MVAIAVDLISLATETKEVNKRVSLNLSKQALLKESILLVLKVLFKADAGIQIFLFGGVLLARRH